ncbi:MAG: TIM barrel protein [Agathobaculum sp.]|jgi:sugar phosphate isomerase/epimerase|uniref:TIM barrel protein n=1 Tax=Agathobaculum sp. TaxID=2048138 RepID=UPI003D900A20
MTNQLAITAITSGAKRAPLVLRGDLVNAVKQAAEWGYDALEIHVIEAGDFPLQLMKDALARYGVRISAIVTGQIFTRRHRCITSPDPNNRAAAMAEVRDYIDIAAELGATDGIVIGWIKGDRPDSRQEEFDRLLADQLRVLGEYAATKGQRILVEVINRYETNLFTTAAELRAFLDKWDLPNCWIHMDTFHMNIDEADMAAAIRTAGSKMGYLHVADSNRLYPGAGHLNFAEVFAALKEIGYRNTISVECIPEPDSDTAGVQSMAFLSKALKGS